MNSVNADILKKYSQLTKVEKNVCDYLTLNLQKNIRAKKQLSFDKFERSNEMLPPSKSLKQMKLEKLTLKEFMCDETLD